jgi:hypothetical protein
LGRRPGPAL